MIFRNVVLSNICLSKKKNKNTDFQITDLKICVLSYYFRKQTVIVYLLFLGSGHCGHFRISW